MPSSAPAVVLLSGGMDSAVTAAVARRDGFAVHALSVRYGQRHALELEAARRVAARLGVVRHVVLDLDLRAFGGSALTSDGAVPKDRPLGEIGAAGEVPSTYVPARNTIFLSLALALAETAGARDVFIGANALDYSGYPDCRPEYVRAFETMANLATAAAVGGRTLAIRAPLIHLTKAEIVALGTGLGVDFGETLTCYDPAPDGEGGALACGRCDACQLRRKGFAEAGVPDPTRYVRG